MMPWILAARPKTLTAGIVPVLLAAALAYYQELFHGPSVLAALVGALAIQIATNYINDGADFIRGADTGERMGPKRMAQAGILSPKKLFIGAGIFLTLAALAGIYLVMRAGWPILGIGILSIICAIAYTAGPYPLAYYGLGDLFVLIFFGFIAVGGAFYAQALSWTWIVFALGAVAGCHGVCLIAINNIRDISTDTKVGKRTFAVWIGARAAKIEFGMAAIIPFLITIGFALYWGDLRFILPFAVFPLAVKNIRRLFSVNTGQEYNLLLAATAKMQIFFGLIMSVVFIWARHK